MTKVDDSYNIPRSVVRALGWIALITWIAGLHCAIWALSQEAARQERKIHAMELQSSESELRVRTLEWFRDKR